MALAQVSQTTGIDELQRRRVEKAFQEITEHTYTDLSLKEIHFYFKVRILSLLRAKRIMIYAVDMATKEVYSRFKVGKDVSEIRVPMAETSIPGYVAKTGLTINILDAYDDQELGAIHPQLRLDNSWDIKNGYRSTQMLVVPIRFHRFTLGVLQLINRIDGSRFTAEDEESARKIAKALGVALYNQLKKSKRRSTKFGYLLGKHLITREKLGEAFGRAHRKGVAVEEVLTQDYRISKLDLGVSLSRFYRTRFIPFTPHMPIPRALLRHLKSGYLRANLWVPLGQEDGRVTVLMDDPNHLLKRDMARSVFKTNSIEFCVGLKEDIVKFLDYFYESPVKQRSINDILVRLEAEKEEEPEEELVTETDNVIVQFVNNTIMDAYNKRASDIHIEPYPGRRDMQIRLRIDGVCANYQTVPYQYKRAVISRLKIMANLDIAERRLPQDGKIRFRGSGGKVTELRMATMPTSGGLEDVVLRLLASGEAIPLDKMGFTKVNLHLFKHLIEMPYGLILVVGPTGSGKTTALHSALAHINTPGRKIWTAEDPVEITQPGLRQVQVNPKIGLTFASAMRSFLRCDPDVIMVGEMRDEETAAIGIEASLTGHLVFTTLHTNSAPETITRLLDMGMDPFNFADSLLGILAQRLVRTLCENCKEPFYPTEGEFHALALEYGEEQFQRLGISYSQDVILHRAKGCVKCNNTGYLGRTGIYELLNVTDQIKRMIQLRKPVEEARSQAKKDGMVTLKQDGIQKVLQGVTHISEVRRVCITR